MTGMLQRKRCGCQPHQQQQPCDLPLLRRGGDRLDGRRGTMGNNCNCSACITSPRETRDKNQEAEEERRQRRRSISTDSNQKSQTRAQVRPTTAGKQEKKKKAQITLGCGFTHISVAERSPTVYYCWSAVRIAVCVKQKKNSRLSASRVKKTINSRRKP
ncbi:hypothetical protein K440DRAFT_176594 [Wilcoxina mikolae CBS 423.85]|nr:hypothetical protein K440DRAFT_176594 [Wilcoxina mikolae CBS 423.85]